MSGAPNNLVELTPWQVVEFPHFIGVRHVNGPWVKVNVLSHNPAVPPVELDVEALGLKVKLHANGIEILE